MNGKITACIQVCLGSKNTVTLCDSGNLSDMDLSDGPDLADYEMFQQVFQTGSGPVSSLPARHRVQTPECGRTSKSALIDKGCAAVLDKQLGTCPRPRGPNDIECQDSGPDASCH